MDDRIFWATLGVAFALLIIAVVNTLRISRKLSRMKAAEAETDEWNRLLRLVRLRRATLLKLQQDGPGDLTEADLGLGPQAAQTDELAATDLFVEKVQSRLTDRADQHHILGTSYALLVFLALVIGVVVAVKALPPIPPDATMTFVVGRTLTLATIVGLVLGSAFFLASLARSHLHESTVLYNRRHTVRLGRLFLYLRFAGLPPATLRKAKLSLTVDDMERAFGSIQETSTAFKTIKPEVLANSPIGQLMRSASEALRSKKVE